MNTLTLDRHLPIPTIRGQVTSASTNGSLLTVSAAADLLGVHANTVRAWTDQGLLTCLRVNRRGDRRYRPRDIDRFLAQATVESRTESLTRRRANGNLHTVLQKAEHVERATHILDEIGRFSATAENIDSLLGAVARLLCDSAGYVAGAVVAPNEEVASVVGRVRADRRLVEQAVRSREPVIGRSHRPDGGYRAAVPIVGESSDWRVIVLAGTNASRSPDEQTLLRSVAAQLTTAERMHKRLAEARDGRRRAELVMAVSSDIGSQLDVPRILDQLVDRATELFDADHAGIFSRETDGSFKTRATRNLSVEFCQTVEHLTTRPVSEVAFEERRIVTVTDFPDDPRAIEMRHGYIKERINTVAVAPLLYDGEPLGILAIYHDTRFTYTQAQHALLEQLASQVATLLRNAQNFSQMATWAAQLQSIQQLGSRLTRLRSVEAIGQAICTELNQLIDYHNVRVYRVDTDDCIPVAWRGEIGEYEDEDIDQLRVKVGAGITGWVARHGLAQNVGDAANDKRAQTIPGTDSDMDESLLLAPMLYEDEVIGVIVLAKLGLNQFSSDDLRLLEIYASIAAQAMANADATEQLRAQSEALTRQLNNQRELLRVTESILSTLDTQDLLQEIAARLKVLVPVDNICVDIHDTRAGLLRPIYADGVQAAEYLAATIRDDQGVGGYVVKTGEAHLVQDELADERVVHFAELGPLPGAMIVAPLRGSERIRGVLTIERLGEDARFSDEEFELVKLFAAHVAIALQNAEAHHQVELRAETDRLTGLGNHGSLIEHIDAMVSAGNRFATLMVDLDFFKRYNDRHGHQAGNVMLQRIAQILRASCRETDRVFRYGGDEFALLLPNTALAGGRAVAEKILFAVNSLGEEDPSAASVNCSIGVAVFPRDGADGSAIILAADRACYAAKRAGRARLATANEGLDLGGDFQPTQPTPAEPRLSEAPLSA